MRNRYVGIGDEELKAKHVVARARAGNTGALTGEAGFMDAINAAMAIEDTAAALLERGIDPSPKRWPKGEPRALGDDEIRHYVQLFQSAPDTPSLTSTLLGFDVTRDFEKARRRGVVVVDDKATTVA